MSDITKLEGGRAAYAYKAVLAVGQHKKYKSLIRKTAPMIQTNGLGATMAFLFAKGDDEHEILQRHIQNWLSKSIFFKSTFTDKKLVEAIIGMESSEYRACTIEILALVNWLKRFAEGMIES